MSSADVVKARLVALGWPEDATVEKDWAGFGAVENFHCYRPDQNVATEAWAAPGSAPEHVAVKGQPLSGTQLALLLQHGQPARHGRAIAQVVVKTAGFGKGYGDALSGDQGALPVELEPVIHAPKVVADPARFVFFVRHEGGGYSRVAAAPIEGEARVSITNEPITLPDGTLLGATSLPTLGPGPLPVGPAVLGGPVKPSRS